MSKFRTKEDITKICDELYNIAVKNWQPSLGYEVLVKGGIVLGIAHEEETRIKALEAKNVELENRLELAEGEWKTYATVSKSLSKKLEIAVEALEGLSHIEYRFVTEGYFPAHPGYYHRSETKTNIAQEALAAINGIK